MDCNGYTENGQVGSWPRTMPGKCAHRRTGDDHFNTPVRASSRTGTASSGVAVSRDHLVTCIGYAQLLQHIGVWLKVDAI